MPYMPVGHKKIPPLRRGSSVIEYAVVIAIVISALLGMQLIVKAHLSGAWRETVDQFGHGHQYEDDATSAPGYSASSTVSVSTF